MIDERGEMDPIEEQQLFRRGYIHTVSLFLMIMAIAMGSYYLWEIYLDPAAKKESEQIENYKSFLQTYEEKMREDTYGGKTPQETLSMFIDALEKGDVDLASKYFLLEQNPESANYLTRKQWEDALRNKDEGGLENLIIQLKQLVPSSRETASSDTVEYVSSTLDGVVQYSGVFKFNNYSGIWKIESL